MTRNDHALARLTEPQRECLRLVMAGYKSKEIAFELGIGVDAVNKRLAGAKAALGATSRFAAARQLAAWEANQASHSLVGQTLAVEHERQSIDCLDHTAVEDNRHDHPVQHYQVQEPQRAYGVGDQALALSPARRFNVAQLVETPFRTFVVFLALGALLGLLIRF